MKTVTGVMLLILVSAQIANAQGFPGVNLRSTNGTWKNAGTIQTDGKPLMLVFWNFDSKESTKQVQALSIAGTEMLGKDEVKMVGVFVDHGGNWQGIAAQIAGYDFGMEVYIDVNGTFMRSLSVPGLPYTQIYSPEMKLVCSYYGYCSGAEDMVCKKVKECLAFKLP